MPPDLSIGPERASIFRITHIENVTWDAANGLQCRSSECVNPDFKNIGNLDLIQKRRHHPVPIPPGGTLSDYVPFYFTSRSPMLYNIRTGYGGISQVAMKDIVIYAGSLRDLDESGTAFVYTDRHAKLEVAEFNHDLAHLNRLDWTIIQRSDFAHDPNDPEKKDRYQAEALIHRDLAMASLGAIITYDATSRDRVRQILAEGRIAIPVLVDPQRFFG